MYSFLCMSVYIQYTHSYKGRYESYCPVISDDTTHVSRSCRHLRMSSMTMWNIIPKNILPKVHLRFFFANYVTFVLIAVNK